MKGRRFDLENGETGSKSFKVVMPGDRIGYAEEFISGEGVYEENGELFAAVAGLLFIHDRIVSVRSLKRVPEVKKGDVVVGRVVDLRNNFAVVEIARKKGENRTLAKKERGILHISNVRDEYVDDMTKAVNYFDIVKARVLDETMRLSTKEAEMGVIKSICSRCRHEMVREGNILKCPECGNTEVRKISPDYGKGEW
jgi:exosome complex component CSL4